MKRGKAILKFTIFAMSLLLSAALVVAWGWSYRHDVVLNVARGGTYREIRVERGRASYLEASSWPREQAVRFTRSAEGGDVLAVAGSSDMLPLSGGESLSFSSPSVGGVWPVQRSTGRVSILYGDMHVLSNPTTQPIATIVGKNITVMATMPATTRYSGVTGVGMPNGQSMNVLRTASGSITVNTGTTSPSSLTISGGGILIFSPGYPYERYMAPVWVLVIVSALPGLLIVALALRRRALLRARRRAGQCVDCGYDLRGGGEVCPECGAPTAVSA